MDCIQLSFSKRIIGYSENKQKGKEKKRNQAILSTTRVTNETVYTFFVLS